MKLRDIQQIIGAETLCGEEWLDREVSGAFSADLMSDVLAFARENALLLTGLTNAQVVRTAEMSDAAGILFVRGKMPPAETVELAQKSKLPLLATKKLMYISCGLLFKSGLLGCSAEEERV